jgi:hypothetical protein
MFFKVLHSEISETHDHDYSELENSASSDSEDEEEEALAGKVTKGLYGYIREYNPEKR